MASNYRVLVSPTSDPAGFTAELPYSDIEYGELLNDAGTAEVTVPLRLPQRSKINENRDELDWSDYPQPLYRFTADELTGLADGETVTAWADAGSNGVAATLTGTLTYNADAGNGRPGVTFDGASYAQVPTGSAPTLTDWTVLVVYKHATGTRTGGSNDVFVDSGSGVFNNKMLMDLSASGTRVYNSTTNRVTVGAADIGTDWHVSYWRTDSAGALSYSNVDGLPGLAAGALTTVDGLTIGAQSSGIQHWNGEIAAVLVWDEDVTGYAWWGSLLADVNFRYRQAESPELDSILTAATLNTPTHLLWIERAGVLLWGGMIWGLSGDVASNSLRVSGAGFHSYMRRRFITATASFSGDQTATAGSLVDTAEATPGALGLIGTNVPATGVNRTRVYNYWDGKNVGDAIDQLAAVENGFDFYYDVSYVSGVPTVTFTTTYPDLGRRTDIVLELGANVELLSFVRDGSLVANEVRGYGAGEGPNKLTAVRSFPNPTGQPLLQMVGSWSDVVEESTLADHAGRVLSRSHLPIEHYQLRMDPAGVPVIGSYLVGDIVRLRGQWGFLDVDEDFRIASIKVSVGAQGEVVDVSLSSLTAFETVV